MAFTVAISNEKGGVAKTTSTLSLGAALAEFNQHVLLVDLDPQANLSLALGFETSGMEITSANVLIENAAVRTAIRRCEVENLDLVPSSSRIESAEQFLPMRSNYMSSLRNSFQNAALPYDYILLDCPPALGAITFNALSAADLLIIPTQAEYFSAYALRNMMGSIRRVRQESYRDRYQASGEPYCWRANYPVQAIQPRFTAIPGPCPGVNGICPRRNP